MSPWAYSARTADTPHTIQRYGIHVSMWIVNEIATRKIIFCSYSVIRHITWGHFSNPDFPQHGKLYNYYVPTWRRAPDANSNTLVAVTCPGHSAICFFTQFKLLENAAWTSDLPSKHPAAWSRSGSARSSYHGDQPLPRNTEVNGDSSVSTRPTHVQQLVTGLDLPTTCSVEISEVLSCHAVDSTTHLLYCLSFIHTQ
jgi:hypothetical protein